MNNLLSYCGLVDAKIRSSDKDLPASTNILRKSHEKTSKGQLISTGLFDVIVLTK